MPVLGIFHLFLEFTLAKINTLVLVSFLNQTSLFPCFFSLASARSLALEFHATGIEAFLKINNILVF